MIPPTEYEEGDLIYKINQGLYRLKQLPKIWYDTLTAFLKELGFTTSNWNTGLWYHKEKQVYLTLYIDNIKLISPDKSKLDFICEKIANRFNIKNLSTTHHYLGMKVMQDREQKQIRLSQEVYIKDLLKQYGMKWCHPRLTPMIDNLRITDKPVDDKDFIKCYQSATGSL